MESVNLVDEKRLQGVIRNYSLLQGPSMNFLYYMNEVICNLGQPHKLVVQLFI
jgi:hypothetical protein